MGLKIHNDHSRFNDVLRGKIKTHLKDFIKLGEFIAHKGREKISIPISQIDLPHFRFLDKSQGGLGQGVGKEGDPLNDRKPDTFGNNKSASSDEAAHELELEISLKELAQILGEELKLPNIDKKGIPKIKKEEIQYSGVHTLGPNALRHFKRTFKNALKRQLATGTYDPNNPRIIPIKEDFRFRSIKKVIKPKSNAVIIYMMDVSGSMGDEQKEIVRTESFWIDTWLRHNYDGIECRYIIHDAMAKEVDQETFFKTRESGGTMISSAYRLCADIIERDYQKGEWNIYPFHFSDGDNWSLDDTRLCIGLLKKRILLFANQFCYGQVESPYGSGQFIKDLKENLKGYERLVVSEIKDREAIYQSIKDFLGQGR